MDKVICIITTHIYKEMTTCPSCAKVSLVGDPQIVGIAYHGGMHAYLTKLGMGGGVAT